MGACLQDHIHEKVYNGGDYKDAKLDSCLKSETTVSKDPLFTRLACQFLVSLLNASFRILTMIVLASALIGKTIAQTQCTANPILSSPNPCNVDQNKEYTETVP